MNSHRNTACRLSSEQLQDNILRAYATSTEDEQQHGSLWWRQAHSLARLLAAVARTDVDRAAAVLAALSPLNRWVDNISDAFAIARSAEAVVRTPNPNRVKAVRILAGEEPEQVLGGPKVLAFWRQIADPIGCQLVAVDRHLLRAALGEWVAPRVAAPRAQDYAKIEEAYRLAALRAMLPLSAMTATVWTVMRRHVAQEGSIAWVSGRGWRRITVDARGRARIFLGVGHAYANSGGWQWLYRYRVMEALGRPLLTSEHVHHIDNDHSNDALENLEVVAASYHGRLHGLAAVVARYRDNLGRFVEEQKFREFPWPRDRAILGPAAIRN